MMPNKFLPGRLKYLTGDATFPTAGGHRFIIHVCNDVGAWGAGFVLALSKRWSQPEKQYQQWYHLKNNFALGEIQVVGVQSDTDVINMVAQHGLGPDEQGQPPIRYDALAKCLEKVAQRAYQTSDVSIHAPRLGAGLAGGDWAEIEKLLITKLVQSGLNVNIYDLK